MASMINTNIASMNAQRNLASSQSSLATSLQRLSSGLRINSAKDDAAGMAISSRMTAQIGGMQQATRNANDGISMSQTAEGAMGSVNDILLRMRDLSVQSSNGTNSTADRKTIQNEVDQLSSEINRISSTTEFNGLKLLDGTSKNNSFQVGANAGQTISFGIKEVSTSAMSLNSTSALGDVNSGRIGTTAPVSGSAELVINGTGIAMLTSDSTAKLQATAINVSTGTTGVSATAYNSVQGTAGVNGVTTGALTINGATIDASANLNDLVSNINKQAGGVTASIGTNGGLSLTNDDGSDILVGGTTTGSGLTAGNSKGYISMTSGSNTPIALTDTTGSGLAKFGLNTSTGSSSVSGSVNTSTAASTDAAAVSALTQTKLLASDSVKINGVALGVTGASASEKAAAINAITGDTGVTAKASTNAFLTMATLGTADSFTVNGTSITLATTDTDSAKVVTAINAAGISGVTASTDAETGRIKLTSGSGSDIVVGNGAAGTAVGSISTDATTPGTTMATANSVAVRGQITLSGVDGAAVRLEESTGGTGLAKLGLVAQGGNAEAVGGKLDVSTQANAQSAIARIDKALSYVSEQRSTMGAVQNRLTSTIANLASSSENISAARSRIQDADFATETASLTKGQILQQAGTAMLAQANSLPNGVMSLLR